MLNRFRTIKRKNYPLSGLHGEITVKIAFVF